ncbi:DUF3325 domain-containing protein [Paraburkholderia xenovorans]|uniref:DUF3325 domain-containing protein n=1 Tax=Paraburkholderia xenovorans TaxID=36873 RepID=UPI0020A6277C|nr:DUF3325 domain-containing protein [Paraburkholderia xenovorans]
MRLLTTILCIVSFVLLAFAMERHQLSVFTRRFSTRHTRTLRIAGWCGLGLTLGIIVSAQGWPLGLVSFSGLISVSAGMAYAGLIVYDRVTRAGRRSMDSVTGL